MVTKKLSPGDRESYQSDEIISKSFAPLRLRSLLVSPLPLHSAETVLPLAATKRSV